MISKNKLAAIEAFRRGYRCVDNQVIGLRGYPMKLYHRPKSDGVQAVYKNFTLSVGSESLKVYAHHLVAWEKFGDDFLAEGIHVRHLDGDLFNNSHENIAIGTASQNQMDRPAADRRRVSSMANKKHSDFMLNQIKEDHASGLSYKAISLKYGIPKSTASYYLSKTAKKRVYVP